MKSEIFNSAILNRQKLKFVYRFNLVELEPHFLGKTKAGRKVIYGNLVNSNSIKMFEFNKIYNIKVNKLSNFSQRNIMLPIFN